MSTVFFSHFPLSDGMSQEAFFLDSLLGSILCRGVRRRAWELVREDPNKEERHGMWSSPGLDCEDWTMELEGVVKMIEFYTS